MAELNDGRGIIRNREKAQRIKSFKNMVFGTISPTDIDCFVEFGDGLFIIVELKEGRGTMPLGQEKALRRLVDIIAPTDEEIKSPRVAVLMLAQHGPEHIDESGDIDVSVVPVAEYYRDGKWYSLEQQKTVREFVEELYKEVFYK